MKLKNKSTSRRNLHYFIITLFLLLAIQFSLSAQNQESQVIGKWKKIVNGTTMTFILDKEMNYTVDFESDGNVEVKGSYEVSGSTITFKDKPGGLATPDPGIYTFRIEEDKITFVIKEDPSVGRSGLVAGTWNKGKE